MVIARAILSDPWASFNTDHPEDAIEMSMLYKLVAFAMRRGNALQVVSIIKLYNNTIIVYF